MTAHELARLLLSLEDKPVVISDEGEYNAILSVELTADDQAIRLLRIP